ncbi:hypothetical protein ODW19_21745, partial [Escherichia coli]|nr:hypothetical protein [Escherichia coli]
MLKKTLLAYTIGFAFSPPANADGIEIAAVDFDRETLKSLGVDPNISHYFSRSALMNPLMILVKIIKLRWIHILSYDQMVSRKINNQTTR